MNTRIDQMVKEAAERIHRETGVKVGLYVSNKMQDWHLQVIDEMTAIMGLTGSEWLRGNRYKKNITMRYIVIAYLRMVCKISLPSLAAFFKCHHTTIMHAVNTHNNMIDVCDAYYMHYYEKVKNYFL